MVLVSAIARLFKVSRVDWRSLLERLEAAVLKGACWKFGFQEKKVGEVSIQLRAGSFFAKKEVKKVWLG